MLTFYVQTYLTIAASGLVMLALMTWIQDYREARADRRENAATAYAEEVMLYRINKGEYDETPLEVLNKDYEDLCNHWLKKH